MRDNFEIIQTISLFDFYKGALHLWRKNKKLRFFIYLPAVMVLVFGLMSIVGSSKPGQASISVFGQVLFLLAFTIGFYLVAFFVILVLMRLMRPGFFKDNLYTFNHWGMYKKAGATEYSRSWKDFSRWEETTSFFFLYIGDNDAHIISKKILNAKEQQEFRDFLNDRFAQY